MFAPVRNFYCDEKILLVGFQLFTFIDILGGTHLYFVWAKRTPQEITISALGCQVLAARHHHQTFSQYSVLELNYSEVFGISLQEWEEMYVLRFHVYFIMLLNSWNSLVYSSLDNPRRSTAF
jgi:hypothetical protein